MNSSTENADIQQLEDSIVEEYTSQTQKVEGKHNIGISSSINNYRKLEKLGEGTYGVVYKAENKITGEIVALKKIRLEKEDDGLPSTALREISLLKSMRHPNVVELKEVLHEGGSLYLVFEYLEYDLRKFMKSKADQKLSPSQVQSFLFQILQALTYLHQHRIFHRDLKPQNILVNSEGTVVKLADFGLAKCFCLPKKTYTHEVVTLWYRCPEILLGQKHYDLGVDLWSTGCIFAEMIQKKPLFVGDSEIDQIFKIFRVLGTPNDAYWPQALKLPDFKPTFPKWKGIPLDQHCKAMDEISLDLLMGMITLDPNLRISARMALMHPYFDTLDLSQIPIKYKTYGWH